MPAPANPTSPKRHTIDSLAYSVGEDEVAALDIVGFDDAWRRAAPGTPFDKMGCQSFARMRRGVEQHVVDSVRNTLHDAQLAGREVDHLVLAMSDPTVAHLRPDFWLHVSNELGLASCVPHLLTFQRCATSISALRYCQALVRDEATSVVLVALDFTPDDAQRVQPYALFGDGVASCLITLRPGLLELRATEVAAEADGIAGDDSFGSRQALADRALGTAMAVAQIELTEVTQVFPANLYQPLAMFNAAAAGLGEQLYFEETLAKYGHCGNADWLINMTSYNENIGLKAGEMYVAQSVAQGFHACAVMEGAGGLDRHASGSG